MAAVAGAEARYEFDDAPARVDLEAVWRYLSTDAYWGRYRSRADVEKQVRGAWRVVGCYTAAGEMVGFCRPVSDEANFRWLLHTADAHQLYRPFGFNAPDSTLMEFRLATTRGKE